MNNVRKIIILSLLLLSACAPEVQPRQFPQPKSDFGPRLQDTDLSPQMKAMSAVKPDLSWQGTAATASYFQQAENLMVLGEQMGKESLVKKGLHWVETFYKQPHTSSYAEFSKSPFATLATTQTEAEVNKTLSEVGRDLERSREILKTKITNLGNQHIWPGKGASLNALITSAEAFTMLVSNQLDKMGLIEVVSSGVKAELKKQTSALFADVKPLIQQLYAAETFPKALVMVEDAIAKFKVQITSQTQASINQGHVIAKDLEALRDPQAGLTILIDIWGILNEADRKAYFQKENESLYDFLLKQDSKELACLRLPGCNGGLINGIAKKLFILPKIEEYGVAKLYKLLNESTLKYLFAEIEKFSQEFILTLPATFVAQIDQGLVAKGKILRDIRHDYGDYLKDLLSDWADKNLPGSNGKVPGFEASAVSVKVSPKQKLEIAATSSTSELKANTAGTSMTANALFLQHSRDQGDFKMRTALSQVNKLIAMGGYRDQGQKMVPALMMPIEKTHTTLDLMTFTKSSISYRIPDKIKMLDSFQASAEPYEKNFSAAAYAEQLKGLSEMINFTADWKHTSFDDSLGKIKAQELTSKIENPALARPLFPKDMLFALNVGDAAVLLKNITKKSTPVFLITLKNNTLWADQYQTGGDDSAIMAGLVDIKNGERSQVVNAQDVSKFLLAIHEFLKATEGVQLTRAPILLERDEHGVTPLKALMEGREELKLLTIALANFISSQLVNENSLVQAHFYLDKMQKSNEENIQIEDQAFAIRALLSAWEITGREIYLWAAHEIYFAMNKHSFDHEEHFYVNGDGSNLSFPQKVNTLRALVELKASLQPKSQAQLERITAPWLKALEELQ
ncbi:hypothetical protein [Bdellovibrio sp. HCB337]|uniref:hypothetical protein n=1 Tax=Bdellovibrio sp. HCB337 TaxID=3394358 RepID=UPI0039A4CF50